jgi:hypothetical protein
MLNYQRVTNKIWDAGPPRGKQLGEKTGEKTVETVTKSYNPPFHRCARRLRDLRK